MGYAPPLIQMTEKELIAQFKKGKQAAFEELYNLHSPRIFTICLRYTKNGPDAEDLLHDAFVKMFEQREKFNSNYAHFYPWAKQLAINHIINTLRSKVKFAENTVDRLETDQPDPETTDEILNYFDNPDNIMRLIRTMPDGYRTIFNMYVFDGLGHPEISETLGISIGTSKSQLARARQFLQKELRALQPTIELKAS